VQCASEGTEAIELYSRAMAAAKPFDVVILDLTIPEGMGGKETVRRLHEMDPNLKAIVSSGYANDPIVNDYKEYGFSGVIVQPYDAGKLEKVIHGVMTQTETDR